MTTEFLMPGVAVIGDTTHVDAVALCEWAGWEPTEENMDRLVAVIVAALTDARAEDGLGPPEVTEHEQLPPWLLQ